MLLMALGGCLEPGPDDAALHAIDQTVPAAPAPALDPAPTTAAAARALEHARQAYIKPSNPDDNDEFGHSVALAGSLLAVGAPFEDSSGAGVGGCQDDDDTEDSGAVYVFRRAGSSWAQEACIKAPNPDVEDLFGFRVALAGNTLAVTAINERSSATGVNGDQNDNSAPSSGAVYMYRRTGSTWVLQAYIKASNTGAGDLFGWSAALEGNTLAVGAIGESSGATGVNGDQNDSSAPESGAVYVFRRAGSSWAQQAYIKASNTGDGDFFGFGVALAANTLAVGAPFEDSRATGVNGDQSDNGASFSGAAYVFRRTGSTWVQQAYIKASNTEAFDQFGRSVALASNTLAVGAPLEDSSATGVNGDQTDNSAPSSGAAYTFRRTGSSWAQQAYIKSSNSETFDVFGLELTLAGNTLVVCAPGEDSSATGVNGDQTDNSVLSSGAAYMLRRTGSTWVQQAYIKASNPDEDDGFCRSVALAGSLLAVGAPDEDSNATAVNGDQTDNSLDNSGAVYVFH